MLDIKNIDDKPSLEDIESYIGIALFKEHYNYLMETYDALCKIEYSKDSLLKGWNVKFRKAGKALCVVYPKQHYFTMLVVVGKKEKPYVEELLPTLSKPLQEIYYNTKEGMGQRWLMIDIHEDNACYQDALKLIQIRSVCK